MKTIDALKQVGIKAEPYKRGPLGPTAFAISIVRGIIRVWEGDSSVTTRVSRKHKQAVLQVKEEARSITRTVRYNAHSKLDKGERDRRLQSELRAQVAMPRDRNVKYTVTDVKSKDIKDADGRVLRIEHTGKVKAHISAGPSQHLLVGVDESANFIAALPKAATSVADAHRLLRPEGVPAGSPRQGEWFFVRVPKELSAALDAFVQRNPRFLTHGTLERNSTHAASTVRYKNVRYAVGFVADRRPDHHAVLWLDDWHRVYRNRETTNLIDGAMARRTRFWD